MSNCHLHKLLEDASNNAVYTFNADKNNLSVDESAKLIRELHSNAPHAICFYMPRIDGGPLPITLIVELIKLPYSNCWFECSMHNVYEHGLLLGAHATQENGAITLSIFEFNDGKSILVGSCVIEFEGQTRMQAHFKTGGNDDELIILRNMTDTVCRFLSALNCTNVIRIEHKPDAKLQRARIRRGKRPLFRFWTLQLDLGERVESAGIGTGTHASPALHLRRGHARQYSPGLYTWVQPHIVGNKKDGIVHKDYAVH